MPDTVRFGAMGGQTLTAYAYADGTVDTEAANATCTEGTNNKGHYTCSLSLTGLYFISVRNANDTVFAQGWVTLTNDSSTHTLADKRMAAGTLLDNVSITVPSGVASSFREMIVQVWRRFFKKATKTSAQLKTYADNGTSVLTTQTVSDVAGTETQEAAS